MANKILMVEGVSDLTYLNALDRRIGKLAAARQTYSRLHELAHQVAVGVNDTGMVIVLDTCLVLSTVEHDHVADLPAALSAVGFQSGTTPGPEPAGFPPFLGLPFWNTPAFAGLAVETWSGHGDASQTADHALSVRNLKARRPVLSRVIFHVPVGTGALLVEGWAAMVRAIDSVLALMLLMRLLVRVGLRHRSNATGSVLIILATCRRYGRRSEPDDHASLPIRRYLVSVGSRLLA